MNRYASVSVLLAGILWGTMGLFVRRLNAWGLASMSIVELRSLFTAILLFTGLAIGNRRALRIRWRDLWCFLGTGVCSVVFFNFCYFQTIAATSLSLAAILLYTSPVFVLLLSALFFRERITLRKVGALILSVTGCALVSGLGGGALSPRHILTGLGAGFGYALYSIFSRCALNRGYSSLTITAYTFLMASIGGAFFTDFSAVGTSLQAHPPAWGFVLLYAVVTTVLPYLLYTYGLQHIPNSAAAVMACVEPVTATICGLMIFHETLTVFSAAGIGLVLIGILLLNLPVRSKPDTDGSSRPSHP